MQSLGPSHDPAPSRLSYRVQRWMLTPGIRLGLRIGVPGLVLGAAVAAFFLTGDRVAQITGKIDDLKAMVRERPEFMVELMAIDGASADLADDIRAALPVDFPASSFDLDPDAMRDTVAALAPVESARVRIRPGGVLQVDVVERIPAALWRSWSGLSLIDAGGVRIARVDSRKDFPDLPLVAGQGADRQIAEALLLIDAAAPLGDRMRGLVRVGERRWDIVLDRDQRILLPVQDPVQALERVIALHKAHEMLDRDLAVVDMRLAARPTLRLTEDAVQELWRIRGEDAGGQDG
ncbi:MAG: cell division protein FtsQ/DivIB [Marinibacterium sp.]|nr:cell division protein FtsQ/DivIB [Marinibacterium sp.]